MIEHTKDNDKLNILINYILLTVYEFISECEPFEDAISYLEGIYLNKEKYFKSMKYFPTL